VAKTQVNHGGEHGIYLGAALAVHQMGALLLLGEQDFHRVLAHDLERALAPQVHHASVGVGEVLAFGDSLLKEIFLVPSEIELAGVSHVDLLNKHVDTGLVVSFLAILDVHGDAVAHVEGTTGLQGGLLVGAE